MKQLLSALVFLLLALPAGTRAQSDAGDNAPLGTVIVFRSRDDDGGAYALTYQTRTLARIKNGNYVVLHLPEGRQYLLADPSAEQIYSLVVVAGQTRYVQLVTDGTLLRRKPSLVDGTGEEFEAELPRMKEIPVREANPDGTTRATSS